MTKYCIISDLHLGCHCDSENWHEIILNWGKWLRDELEEQYINNIIICGDFFDNRNEIGVKTISVAGELMDIWSDFAITMITGNHDLFYKNRNDVNSVSIFTGRSNITVISTMETMDINGKTVTFIPWGSDISKAPKSDVIFGHLEINGFRMMPGKVAEYKTPATDLTSKSPLTFSGHFHLRDERTYKKSKIIYVGSPYQLNWGESSNIPGYYTIDMGSLEYEFHENLMSPVHIKMSGDDLKLKYINSNIVAVDIDTTLDDIEIERIKSKVYSENPLEVKFTILREVSTAPSGMEYSSNIDIGIIMGEFVDGLELEDYSLDVKGKLKDMYSKHTN